MTFITKIILLIIVLHLIVGFGWMIWKLSPRKGDQLVDSTDSIDDTADQVRLE